MHVREARKREIWVWTHTENRW